MTDESGPGAAPVDDPTEVSAWRPVHRLLSDLAGEVADGSADPVQLLR